MKIDSLACQTEPHASHKPKHSSKNKMPAKLFLYKAAQANVVAILRRGPDRETWELIRWDLDTDTFTEGQWLLKKQMNGKYAAISPCGRYFAYHYNIYTKESSACHGVISALPNFTALYFNEDHFGNWESIRFTEKGEINGPPMVKKGNVELSFVDHKKPIISSGFIAEAAWTDLKGRVITTVDGKLFADGVLHYDTTEHAFIARSPVA